MNSLLCCACCPGTMCLPSASFLTHFSLDVAGLRAPLSRFLEGALYKYPESMNEFVCFLILMGLFYCPDQDRITRLVNGMKKRIYLRLMSSKCLMLNITIVIVIIVY